MSSWRAVVITLSDSSFRGSREDLSGPALRDELEKQGIEVLESVLLPDDFDSIRKTLIDFSNRSDVDLIMTTGGTGLSARDITPEATLSVLERNVPGIAEWLRLEGMKKFRLAVLSRGVAGIRNRTLIVNLPGSVKAVRESMIVLEGLLSHALGILSGSISRCAG